MTKKVTPDYIETEKHILAHMEGLDFKGSKKSKPKTKFQSFSELYGAVFSEDKDNHD